MWGIRAHIPPLRTEDLGYTGPEGSGRLRSRKRESLCKEKKDTDRHGVDSPCLLFCDGDCAVRLPGCSERQGNAAAYVVIRRAFPCAPRLQPVRLRSAKQWRIRSLQQLQVRVR